MPGLARLAGMLITLSTILLAALSIVQSLATWREDMVEGRRRFRMLLIGSAACYSMLMAGVALVSGYDAREVFSSTANAFGIAVLSLLVSLQLTRATGNDLFAAPQASPQPCDDPVQSGEVAGESPGPGIVAPAAVRASDPAPPDPALVQALKKIMVEERLYREENLSVSSLAERMRLPEHKLRKLINQGMGYRNFNVFLNTYRIGEVSQVLSDPAQAEVPVLEIALDAGFQSIGPFNRAFKAMTGQTPTEFRRSKGMMAVE
jgi:AraC-like DNA-binding protein